MSLYLYQCSPTHSGTVPGAKTRARWGRIGLPLQPALPGRPLIRLCLRQVTCAPPSAATAGCICHRPAAPARAFKYADRGRLGGGGRGRKAEEGGRERSGELRGEPQLRAQGTRCEGVSFPPPTPLPAGAPSPATPPPFSVCPPGACCFLFKGRNCASLGAPGALIYIFLCPALTLRSNGSLHGRPGARMPASKNSRQNPTRSSPCPGPRCPLGPVALSPFCLSFSFLVSLYSTHFFLSCPLFSHFPVSFFLLPSSYYSPPFLSQSVP